MKSWLVLIAVGLLGVGCDVGGGTLTGTTYSGITGLIQSGRTGANNGDWLGTGITSSTVASHAAAGNLALGVATATDLGVTGFSGATGLNNTTSGAQCLPDWGKAAGGGGGGAGINPSGR